MVEPLDEVQRAVLGVLELLAQNADRLLETDVVLLAAAAPTDNAALMEDPRTARYIIDDRRETSQSAYPFPRRIDQHSAVCVLRS